LTVTRSEGAVVATAGTLRPVPGLVLQHGPLGPPDRLGGWLERRGLAYEVCEAWRAPLPEDVARFDFVASLGARESAAAREPGWVAAEVALLRRAVAADVPVLGLCFGGQALAVALGARVGPARVPEVGWLEVDTDAPELVPPGPWLHFHWETFAVPPGATELARTPAGSAAYVAGPHLATQFHPEASPEVVDAWAHAEPRIAPLGLTPRALLDEGRRASGAAAAAADRLFDAWWARAAGAP
jgi:GMP synthase-like glutamine amidotransferase